jgi:hypothetical protein
MEALTDDNIHRVHDQLPVKLDLDATTVAYLRTILIPYAQAAEQATTLESWFPQVFTATFVEQAHYWIEKGPEELRLPTADALTNARKAVIDFLIDSTLYLATDKAQSAGSNVVLPWDVHAGIVGDMDSRLIFGVTGVQLPVIVRIGGTDFEHTLSEEFVAGILESSHTGGRTVKVYMFGVPLGAQAFDQRHDPANALPYRITLTHSNKDRAFATPDYLTGVATAAQWRGEDFHTSVTDLRYIDASGTTHSLTF